MAGAKFIRKNILEKTSKIKDRWRNSGFNFHWRLYNAYDWGLNSKGLKFWFRESENFQNTNFKPRF